MLIVDQDFGRALALANEVKVIKHMRFALPGSANAIREDSRLRHLNIGIAD